MRVVQNGYAQDIPGATHIYQDRWWPFEQSLQKLNFLDPGDCFVGMLKGMLSVQGQQHQILWTTVRTDWLDSLYKHHVWNSKNNTKGNE